MRRRISHREIDVLADVPLFSACNERELRQIAGLGTPIDVGPGQTLTTVGGIGKEFFVLLEGEADCTVASTKFAHFTPGDFFGELTLLDGPPRTATVTTTKQSRLLVFGAKDFQQLMKSSTTITRKLLSVMATRIRAADALDTS